MSTGKPAVPAPRLMASAVTRVSATERGSVVGTASAFLDVALGIAPAILGTVAGLAGHTSAFLVGAAASLARGASRQATGGR